MSKRNPIATEFLRRSTRFLTTNSPEPFDPKTPKSKPETNRFLHSCFSPVSPTLKPKGSNNSNKLGKPRRGIYVGNSVELRRSGRLSKIKNQEEDVKNGIGSEGRSVLRRAGKKVESCSVISKKGKVGRSVRKRGGLGIKDCNLSKNLKTDLCSANGKTKLGVDLCKEVEKKIEKRVTRSDSCKNECENEKSNCDAKFQGHRTPALSENAGKEEFDNETPQEGGKLNEENFLGEEKGKNVGRGKERIGKKRELNQDNGNSECAEGWTEEQERALQRAYFVANPTPQFWKRVAKMVPGKSAQACFDKIHSAHLTPLQTQPRSRAKKITPSALSFSASKFLNSSEPKKKSRCSHLAKKTVRQLLRKQCNNTQVEGPDLFAIFEEAAGSSNGASQQPTSCCTPETNKQFSIFQNRCRGSSSAHKKSLSRLNMSSGSRLPSPPVLKQIKNKALHERYVDQLHRRETKRKAALSRAAKQAASQNNKLGTQDGNVDALNVARNALFFGASDAINQFQQSQMNASCDLSDDDHLGSSNDDEEED